MSIALYDINTVLPAISSLTVIIGSYIILKCLVLNKKELKNYSQIILILFFFWATAKTVVHAINLYDYFSSRDMLVMQVRESEEYKDTQY